MKAKVRVAVGLAVLLASFVPASLASLPPPVPECMNLSDDDGDGGTDWIGINKNNIPNIIDNPDQDCDWPFDNSETARSCKHLHQNPHSHTYNIPGITSRTRTATWADSRFPPFSGSATVWDNNLADCDGDGSPGDFDGDYETGVGGGFFGFGPWRQEPICDYDLANHGPSVVVNDVVWGSQIVLLIGADDTSGPVVEVDPVDGSTSCSTDGHINPCEGNPGPTCDSDDCLALFIGHGTTCGAGGDGGYWVFHPYPYVVTGPAGIQVGNPPTFGTITA